MAVNLLDRDKLTNMFKVELEDRLELNADLKLRQFELTGQKTCRTATREFAGSSGQPFRPIPESCCR